MNKPEEYNSNIINELMDSVSQEEKNRVENKMIIAAKIKDALLAKGWKNKDLMNAMGKSNPSVITKWLSGTHNFTMDTLSDLQKVLGIKLLNIEETNQLLYTIKVEITQPIHMFQTSRKLSEKFDEVPDSTSFITC